MPPGAAIGDVTKVRLRLMYWIELCEVGPMGLSGCNAKLKRPRGVRTKKCLGGEEEGACVKERYSKRERENTKARERENWERERET